MIKILKKLNALLISICVFCFSLLFSERYTVPTFSINEVSEACSGKKEGDECYYQSISGTCKYTLLTDSLACTGA